jgi:hypothetical protein
MPDDLQRLVCDLQNEMEGGPQQWKLGLPHGQGLLPTVTVAGCTTPRATLCFKRGTVVADQA